MKEIDEREEKKVDRSFMFVFASELAMPGAITVKELKGPKTKFQKSETRESEIRKQAHQHARKLIKPQLRPMKSLRGLNFECLQRGTNSSKQSRNPAFADNWSNEAAVLVSGWSKYQGEGIRAKIDWRLAIEWLDKGSEGIWRGR